MPLPYGPPFYFKAFSHNHRAEGVCYMGQIGSKRAKNGLNSHPCAPQMVRDNFWSHFWPQKWPIFMAFLGFEWAKLAQNGPQNVLISVV